MSNNTVLLPLSADSQEFINFIPTIVHSGSFGINPQVDKSNLEEEMRGKMFKLHSKMTSLKLWPFLRCFPFVFLPQCLFFIIIRHSSFCFELWTGQLTRSTSIDGWTNESWEQNNSDKTVIQIHGTNNLPHQRNKTRWQLVGWSVSWPLSFLCQCCCRPLLSASPHRQLNMYVTGTPTEGHF